MWNDFVFSVNTVIPILVIIAAGFGARTLKLINEEGLRQGNRWVFYLFLPLLLFNNIKDSAIDKAADPTTLVYAAVTLIACFLALFYLIPRVTKDRNACGVLIQGIARANYAIYGIPLVTMIYPNADISIAVMIVVFAIPIFNVFSTVALMKYGGVQKSGWDIVRGVLVNPLILGTLLGLGFLLLKLRLPAVIEAPVRMMGGIASPFALFLLGAGIDFSRAKGNRRLLAGSVTARLVLVPLVFLTGAVLLGIRDVNLATLIALYGSPTAVSSFPMTQQLGGDADLAAQQVIFTTVFSGVTIFIWLFVLKSLGFLAA